MDIYPIKMGVCTSYLIRDRGAVVVDAGEQGHGDVFQRRLAEAGVSPAGLTLIFLTHGHWDHIAFLGELRALSRAPAAINHREKPWVEGGLKANPPPITAWGKIVMAFLMAFLIPKQTFGGVPVEIGLGDEPCSLEPYGLDGTLIYTPGHSSGSMSLLLKTGEAFVGDLAVGGPPLSLGPSRPPFAEDPDRIAQSWRALLEAGATVIYPAHGRPFPASTLERLLRSA